MSAPGKYRIEKSLNIILSEDCSSRIGTVFYIILNRGTSGIAAAIIMIPMQHYCHHVGSVFEHANTVH